MWGPLENHRQLTKRNSNFPQLRLVTLTQHKYIKVPIKRVSFAKNNCGKFEFDRIIPNHL